MTTPDTPRAEIERLRATLAEVEAAVAALLDRYDPENPGTAFDADPGCLDCTCGVTPNKFNTGLCPRHRLCRALALLRAKKGTP